MNHIDDQPKRNLHIDLLKPTFIHIGPGRSATTMLYEAFKEHPDICMAKNTKETNYFGDEYHRGETWYFSFFEDCSPKNAIGEVSNKYIYHPDVPQRIYKLLPDAKLLTVLRNPFERILSVYSYRLRAGEINSTINLESAFNRYPDLITDNYYGQQLRRFLDWFPTKQIFIAFYDDLENSPQKFIKDIYSFIDVDPNFQPEAIHKRVNDSVAARSALVAILTRKVADTLRRMQLHLLLIRAKESTLLRNLLFRKNGDREKQAFSYDLKLKLREHFFPQIEEVEKITGRDLSSWYKS